jgi:hypothetical protein
MSSAQLSESDRAYKGRVGYSINEAAAVAGLGRDSIYAAIRAGKLVARKYGKRTIILDPDLRAFLGALPRMELAP